MIERIAKYEPLVTWMADILVAAAAGYHYKSGPHSLFVYKVKKNTFLGDFGNNRDS